MLKVNRLSFNYPNGKNVIDSINFQLKQGEILSVLGESGSGKSTLLKLIYGWEDAVSGEIFFENKLVSGPKFNLVPGNPLMKFVPQEFDLLDSVTVAENTGKYLSNFDLDSKSKNVLNALEVVKLKEFSNQFPSRLSGGQRQRISIARAIASNPKLLLLDEPYGQLDQPLKFEIRRSIYNWAKRNKRSIVLTTHDYEDALGFSDKILIIKSGKAIQFDSPKKIRNQPKNEYVASLLGEYSILNSEELNSFFQIKISGEKKAIIYPEEFSESQAGTAFNVVDVRFGGRDFLIQAEKGNLTLKYFSKEKPKAKKVKLAINHYRLV